MIINIMDRGIFLLLVNFHTIFFLGDLFLKDTDKTDMLCIKW